MLLPLSELIVRVSEPAAFAFPVPDDDDIEEREDDEDETEEQRFTQSGEPTLDGESDADTGL